MSQLPVVRLILVSVVALQLLSACGGGSGGGTAPVTPTAPPPPPPAPSPAQGNADDYRTAEYNLSWGLDAINAAEAYARGYTGEDVTIGIVDFNFDFSSSEVDYLPASKGPDPEAIAIYEAQFGEPAESSQHGHAVAVVAAGVKNDSETHGVAFDAQVLAADYFSNVNESQFMQGGVLFHISNPWTYLTDRGARVVNKSLGYDEDDVVTNPPVVDEKYGVETDAYVVAEGALLVASAGNNGDADPSLSNLDTIDILRENNLLDQGPGAFIIVGAVDETGTLAPFSDRAGIAKDYYMVAPGVDIVFPWNGELIVGSGTSFSAPHVTGAAAILFQRWPNLTARDVMNILFDSATDLGAPGVDVVYGHGMLNLDAALQPMGNSTVAVAGTVVRPDVRQTALVLSSAFGDAPGLAHALSSVLMFDGYDRDYQIDLGRLVTPLSHRPRLSDIADQQIHWQASQLALPGLGFMSTAVQHDVRDEEIRALVGGAQSPDLVRDRHIIQFDGEFAGLGWTAGSGRQLTDALSDRHGIAADVSAASLTGAFRHALSPDVGQYAIADWPLTNRTGISVGFSHSKSSGHRLFGISDFRAKSENYAIAVRLDRQVGPAAIGLQAGALVENGTLLGSRAAGGLSLDGQTQSGWVTLDANVGLTRKLLLTGSMTAAVSNPQGISDGVIASMGNIFSTGFSFGLATYSVLNGDDHLLLSIHQPLRVESASALIRKGIARNYDTGQTVFADEQVSLAPSGREIGFETAYEVPLSSWNIAANLAFRRNADHVAGRNEVALLFGLNRRY